jgi:hypothetical protein
MINAGDEFSKANKNNSSANSCSFKFKSGMQGTHNRVKYYIVTKATRVCEETHMKLSIPIRGKNDIAFDYLPIEDRWKPDYIG